MAFITIRDNDPYGHILASVAQEIPVVPNTQYSFSIYSWQATASDDCAGIFYVNPKPQNRFTSYITAVSFNSGNTGMHSRWVATTGSFNSGAVSTIQLALQVGYNGYASGCTIYMDSVTIQKASS